MSIIAFILKFAFIFFIAFLVIILWVAYAFYRQITRARRQFNPNAYQYQEPRSTENTIIDNRPMEERNKQVIPDSEGEYVDFTESDDTQS
mgnify:FL=1